MAHQDKETLAVEAGRLLDPEPRPPLAWQPFTPYGVAAFALASGRCLAVAQLIFALLLTATLLWFVHSSCLPTLRAAIERLPDEGRIHQQTLSTPYTSPQPLAENRILSLAVNLPGQPRPGRYADFQFEFQERGLLLGTRFGDIPIRYPKQWTIAFNRKELQPALDAWTPVLMVAFGVVLVLAWQLFWMFCASLLWLLPYLVARYAGRPLSCVGSWKLAVAACLPGTLLGAGALLGYAQGWMGLLVLLLTVGLYGLVTGFYLMMAPIALPPPPDLPLAPETPPPSASTPAPARKAKPDRNPFLPAPPPGVDPTVGNSKNPFAAPE